MKNNLIISVCINILLIFGIGYLAFYKDAPIVDVSVYEHKIDSLNNLITINNNKIDSLSGLEITKEKDIDELKKQLAGLSNKNKDLKKKYDEEVALINTMSNDDVVSLFTKTFK